MPDAVVNSEQAQAWNGPEGSHWADHQDRWNAVNEGFNEPLLGAVGLTPEAAGDHRVLDLGCGSGQTTRLAALRAPHGHALGLDLSGPMLTTARERAAREGIANAAFAQGDAQVHPFAPGAFDAAVSRFGVMFFADPAAAFGNIGRALRPGGRLAFVCPADAALNDWVAAMASLRDALPATGFPGDFGRPGLPGMFSLAAPDRIHEVLSAAGFTRVGINQVQAYGTWGHDAEDAADFLLGTGPGRHLMDGADASARVRARRVLTDHLHRHLHLHRTADADGAVRLRSTAWLVTADRPATSWRAPDGA